MTALAQAPAAAPEELLPLLEELRRGCAGILGEDLTGLWLHGSAAMGCWNPLRSDLDLLAVAEAPLEPVQKRRLLDVLEALWPQAPAKGIELSVVLRDVAMEPFFPAPYELHYSPGWRAVYRADPDSLCNCNYKTDRDLPAHFAVVRAWGIPLAGPEAREVFGPVAREDFLRSVLWDLDSSEADLPLNPTPVILNLCRTLAFVHEGRLLSKAQGGRWAAGALPEWKWLVCRALEDYGGRHHYTFDLQAGRAFCRQALEEIRALAEAGGGPAL